MGPRARRLLVVALIVVACAALVSTGLFGASPTEQERRQAEIEEFVFTATEDTSITYPQELIDRLNELGQASASQLRVHLRSRNRREQWMTVCAVAESRIPVDSLVPILIELAQDESDRTPTTAVLAMVALGRSSTMRPQVVEVLVRIVREDARSMHRRAAGRTLRDLAHAPNQDAGAER